MTTFSRAHGTFCTQPYKGECLQFSTDGTRLGADIAHTMGTTDEEEIKASVLNGEGSVTWTLTHCMTGMDAEQREWEGLDDTAEDGDEEDDGDF